MEHALTEGDYVILSTGAIATVRRSYPAGYSGLVDILLDGSEESERSEALTLPETSIQVTEPETAPAVIRTESDERGETRGQSVRMED